MGRIFAVALCLIALPFVAHAGDLSGRWNVRIPTNPGYEGVTLIDGQQRVTWDAPLDNGRPAKFVGYVRFNDGSKIELVITDRAGVVHINCVAASSELLQCRSIRADKTLSHPYSLVRVGDAPAKFTAPR